MDFLFGNSGPYTKRELVLLGSWEPWLQILVISVGLVVLGLTAYNYRRLAPFRRRVLLIGIRSLIVLFLVAMFYQPAYLEENIAKSRNHVLVLVDDSESLQLPHGAQKRHELIKHFIERHESLWEEISEKNDLHFYRFSETLRALPSPSTKRSDLEQVLTATGKKTQLVQALGDVRRLFRNRDLGGIVVLTDGVDTGASGRRGHLSPAEEMTIKRL